MNKTNPFPLTVYISSKGQWCSYDGTVKPRPTIPGSRLMSIEVPPANELVKEVVNIHGRPTTFFFKPDEREAVMNLLAYYSQ